MTLIFFAQQRRFLRVYYVYKRGEMLILSRRSLSYSLIVIYLYNTRIIILQRYIKTLHRCFKSLFSINCLGQLQLYRLQLQGKYTYLAIALRISIVRSNSIIYYYQLKLVLAIRIKTKLYYQQIYYLAHNLINVLKACAFFQQFLQDVNICFATLPYFQ